MSIDCPYTSLMIGCDLNIPSQHLGDEVVDEVLAVSPVSSTLDGVALADETSTGWGKLEGPEEVVGLLEVGTNVVDLVDEVLNADDVLLLAKGVGNDVVVGERNALSINLAVATLVDELADGVTAGITVSDIWLNATEHVDGSLVDADEDTVVQLAQPQQPQDANDLGVQLHDTTDSHGEDELGFGRHIKGTALLSLSCHDGCTFLRSSVC